MERILQKQKTAGLLALPFIIKTFIWLFIMFSPTRQAISGRRPESLALRWLTAFCIR